MKRGILIMIFSLLLCSVGKVQAAPIYYTTDTGIELTEDEYNYVLTTLGEGQLDILTTEMYNIIHALDFENREVTVTTYEDYQDDSGISLASEDFYETASKTIDITSSCGTTNCLIVISGYWKRNPYIRSYDVIGARLVNTYFSSNNSTITILNSSAGQTVWTSSYYNTFTNGVGCSMKLPSGATDIAYLQSFNIEPYGTVFATYQHATSSISLTNSKRYSLSISGYGNVLLFDSAIRSYYDQMDGVYITI